MVSDSSYSPLVQTHVNTITRVTKVLIIYGGCQSTHATFYGRRKVIFIEAVSNLFQLLQVSPVEWLKFVEDDVHNGFYPVAVKGASKEYWSVTPDQGYKL
ncbi:hypothetical protein P8452_55937 [Trifolium repens]|nr:hypothetical protein P8452_55937 [Trifolium repens]